MEEIQCDKRASGLDSLQGKASPVAHCSILEERTL